MEYDGHCYLKYTLEKKWEEARTYCRDHGGYLLSIESAAENNFIEGAFSGGDYWIGGNDLDLEGVFVWDSGNALIFDNWKDNEPNGHNSENCMRFDSDWMWRDRGCM